MKLATWNVNSIRARHERLRRWLEAQAPDVVCLQELKVRDEDFPHAELLDLGYHAAVYGQKTYNGVAILSRTEPRDVERGLGDDVDDPQARAISALVAGVRVLSLYVPNGGEMGSEKYAYKQEWLRRLRAMLDRALSIPPSRWRCVATSTWLPSRGTSTTLRPGRRACCSTPRCAAALEHVRGFGLTDTLRLHHEEGGLYSWWDYRMLAFPKNRGLRIDHIFASRPLATRCVSASIDRQERKGKQPSDHAPVIATFELG